MAGLTNPVLTLTRDRATKTVHAVATCGINFNRFELSAMEQGLQFRMRVTLFGADTGLAGRDDVLYTFTPPTVYPDATPTAVEDVRFEETLGEQVVDEDLIGTDEVYARFALTNLFTQITVDRVSPEVTTRL